MGYQGSERRVHRIFVTRNTEYHLRQDCCVAVRDRTTGQWLRAHMALRQRIAGGIRFQASGGIVPTPGLPQIGDSLLFEASGRDLITSTVLEIGRPPVEALSFYQQAS